MISIARFLQIFKDFNVCTFSLSLKCEKIFFFLGLQKTYNYDVPKLNEDMKRTVEFVPVHHDGELLKARLSKSTLVVSTNYRDVEFKQVNHESNMTHSHYQYYTSITPPKQSGKGRIKKGKEIKSRLPKSTVVIDGVPVSELSRAQLEKHVGRLQVKLQKERDMRLIHEISVETTTTRDYAAPEFRAYDELWGGDQS